MKLLIDSMLRTSGRTRSGDEERNLDAVVSSFEALAACDESQIDRCYSQDYLEHAPTVPGSTRDELKQFVLSFGSAHPRGELRLKRLLADGDYVYVESAGRFEPEDRWTTINEVFRLEGGNHRRALGDDKSCRRSRRAIPTRTADGEREGNRQ